MDSPKAIVALLLMAIGGYFLMTWSASADKRQVSSQVLNDAQLLQDLQSLHGKVEDLAATLAATINPSYVHGSLKVQLGLPVEKRKIWWEQTKVKMQALLEEHERLKERVLK